MKWRKSNKIIEDAQTGEIICYIAQTTDPLRDKMLELAPEIFAAFISYVDQIENGKFAAKSVYNDLKEIMDRIPEELLQNEGS